MSASAPPIKKKPNIFGILIIGLFACGFVIGFTVDNMLVAQPNAQAESNMETRLLKLENYTAEQINFNTGLINWGNQVEERLGQLCEQDKDGKFICYTLKP